MSIKIMTLAWQVRTSHTDKLVLLALSDNANDEGQCFPSIATLMEKSCAGERTIQEAIARLKDAGHLSCQYRPGRSTLYLIHPRASRTGAGTAPPQEAHPAPAAPHPRASRTPTPAPAAPGGAPAAPITVTKPSSEPSPNQPELVVHESLPAEEWEEWLAHRRSKRWPCDGRTLGKQLKILARYETAIQREMIDTAINAGWQGIFPPRGNVARQSPKPGAREGLLPDAMEVAARRDADGR